MTHAREHTFFHPMQKKITEKITLIAASPNFASPLWSADIESESELRQQ